MIALTADMALLLYLALTLFFLLGVWTYQHFHTRRKPGVAVEQQLFICEYCHFAYLASTESGGHVTQCPQCHTFNKHNHFLKDKS